MAHNHDKDVKFIGDSRVRDRKHANVPKDFSEYPGKTEPFWPNFLLREWMVGAVVLIGFLILLVEHPAPLGETPADPTNTSFIPVPDWYFLFLYQFLKYDFVAGPFVILGIIVLPGLAFGGLMLAPFLDRGKERRPSKRPIATSMMLVALACTFYLTWAAVQEHHEALLAAPPPVKKAPSADQLPALVAADDPAHEVFKAQSCVGCHGADLEGTPTAPPLLGVGDKFSKEQIIEIMTKGKKGEFGTMPPNAFNGSDADKQALAEWLAKQKKAQ